MKLTPTALAFVATMVAGVWGFVGVERLVGDHEVGNTWAPFIKHAPNFQLRFANPAQKGLDFVPFGELSSLEKQELIQFCAVRFGLASAQPCYDRMKARTL